MITKKWNLASQLYSCPKRSTQIKSCLTWHKRNVHPQFIPKESFWGWIFGSKWSQKIKFGITILVLSGKVCICKILLIFYTQKKFDLQFIPRESFWGWILRSSWSSKWNLTILILFFHKRVAQKNSCTIKSINKVCPKFIPIECFWGWIWSPNHP